jgi:hypothetical protein
MCTVIEIFRHVVRYPKEEASIQIVVERKTFWRKKHSLGGKKKPMNYVINMTKPLKRHLKLLKSRLYPLPLSIQKHIF